MGLFTRKKASPEKPEPAPSLPAEPVRPVAPPPVRTFPSDPEGPLCALLNNAEVLFEFYETAGLRKDLKKVCKTYRWEGKPPLPYSMGPESLKAMLLSLLESPPMRKRINSMDAGSGTSPALHQAIWTWFAVRNPKLAALAEKHTHEVKGRLFMKPEAFGKLVEAARTDGMLDEKAPFQLACVAVAFAILQPEEAPALLKAAGDAFPELRDSLVG